MEEPAATDMIAITINGVEDEVINLPQQEISLSLQRGISSSIMERAFQVVVFPAGVERISRVRAQAVAQVRRWLYRTPRPAIELMLSSFGNNGEGEVSYSATVVQPENGMMFPEGVDGDDGDFPLPPPVDRVALSSILERGYRIVASPDVYLPGVREIDEILTRDSAEAGTGLTLSLHRTPPLATGLTFNTFGVVDGDDGDGVLLPETAMMVNAFSGADGGPPLPPPVDRFMQFRIYASIPAISGTWIHILAGMMEPTTLNKKLIGVSMISLVGNVAASTWLIFRGGNLPNSDWKNIGFKIMFVFSGTLTFYASFSTLASHWFRLPGIVVCGVLAVGLGHSEGLKRVCKKFTATIKNATQKIRELIA